MIQGSYITLRYLYNTNFQILSTKTPPGNLTADFLQKKKKIKKNEIKKYSNHFSQHLLGILGEFPENA